MNLRRALREPRLLVLGAILAGCALLKAVCNPYPVGYWSDDGSYYYQIARHVAAGDGLLTDVSLYHQGLQPLPHPAPIYPLWPVLLGTVGAVAGLDTAAVWLPELLYLASLLLLYRLALAVASRFGSPGLVSWGGRPILDVGHAMVLLFALNPIYFRSTSLPFTEGLAFTVAFGTILALQTCAETPTAWAGLVAGTLGALAFLARSQFVAFALAPSACLGVLSLRHASLRRPFVTATAATGAVLVPWAVYLTRTFGVLKPAALLDVTAFRQDVRLEPYHFLVDRGSVIANIADRAKGVYVAFHPTHWFSYIRSFGYVPYIVPLAVLVALVRPRQLRPALAAAFEPRTLAVTATLLTGAGSLVLVHLEHSTGMEPWYFGSRQGLPLVFFLVVALGFLVNCRSSWLRAAAVVLVGLSLWHSAGLLRFFFSSQLPNFRPPTQAQVQLTDWIRHQPSSSVFMARDANSLAAITGGRFHFAECDDRPDVMAVFFGAVGVDYLVTTPGDWRCSFLTLNAQHLQRVVSFGEGRRELVVWQYSE